MFLVIFVLEKLQQFRQAEEEQMAWAVGIVIIVLFLGAVGWGISEIGDLCAKSKCGR